MKFFKILLVSLLIFKMISVNAQDTFSIVAIDPETGDVGSAGASCVIYYLIQLTEMGFWVNYSQV